MFYASSQLFYGSNENSHTRNHMGVVWSMMCVCAALVLCPNISIIYYRMIFGTLAHQHFWIQFSICSLFRLCCRVPNITTHLRLCLFKIANHFSRSFCGDWFEFCKMIWILVCVFISTSFLKSLCTAGAWESTFRISIRIKSDRRRKKGR